MHALCSWANTDSGGGRKKEQPPQDSLSSFLGRWVGVFNKQVFIFLLFMAGKHSN